MKKKKGRVFVRECKKKNDCKEGTPMKKFNLLVSKRTKNFKEKVGQMKIID